MKYYFGDMRVSAKDTAQEESMKTKYKDWTEMPMMTSPGITIN